MRIWRASESSLTRGRRPGGSRTSGCTGVSDPGGGLESSRTALLSIPACGMPTAAAAVVPAEESPREFPADRRSKDVAGGNEFARLRGGAECQSRTEGGLSYRSHPDGTTCTTRRG